MKTDYDAIIEENLFKIKEKEVFSSLAELFRELGFNSKNYSKNKRDILVKHIKQYIVVSSTNNPSRKNEIIVETVRDKKEQIVDNRKYNKGGNNKKYVMLVEPIIMGKIKQCLQKKTDDTDDCTITVSYSQFYEAIIEDYSYSLLEIQKADGMASRLYKEKIRRTLQGALESSLSALANKNYLIWRRGWTIVSKGQQKDRLYISSSGDNYTYVANEREEQLIEDYSKKYCEEKGCTIHKMWTKYYKDYTDSLRRFVEEHFGYSNVYKVIIITVHDANSFINDTLGYDSINDKVDKFKQTLCSTMNDFVFFSEHKKYSKRLIEKFREEYFELYELCYSDMDSEKEFIIDLLLDNPSDKKRIDRINEALFGKKFF